MDVKTLETIARVVGVGAVLFAWFEAGSDIAAAQKLQPGPRTGMARRIGVLPAYLLTAVPYFAICAVLWRPLPLELGSRTRLVGAVVGLELGMTGVFLYVWGQRTLGRMYQVSGTLGTGLHHRHRLVTSGPYQMMRHPMYSGIILAAAGGLVLYRVWTFVFILAGVPGMVRRARTEERLLEAAFPDDYASYRSVVPGWFPRPGCVRRSLKEGAAATRRILPENLGLGGRLFRGLVVVPGATVVALSGAWVVVVVPFAVVALTSAVTALSGHCFICDLDPRLRRVHGH